MDRDNTPCPYCQKGTLFYIHTEEARRPGYEWDVFECDHCHERLYEEAPNARYSPFEQDQSGDS